METQTFKLRNRKNLEQFKISGVVVFYHLSVQQNALLTNAEGFNVEAAFHQKNEKSITLHLHVN